MGKVIEPDEIKNFSKKISSLQNFKDVEIWGQPSYSYPSISPTNRVITELDGLHGIFAGSVCYYMVAQEKRKKREGVVKELSSQIKAFSKVMYDPGQEIEDYPEALPMNCYKNDKKVRSVPQSYFNTHLEKRGL